MVDSPMPARFSSRCPWTLANQAANTIARRNVGASMSIFALGIFGCAQYRHRRLHRDVISIWCSAVTGRGSERSRTGII